MAGQLDPRAAISPGVVGLLQAQLGYLAQPLLAQVAEVDGGAQGDQGLAGADVGGGLLAPDVLLAGVQGEHVAPPAVRRRWRRRCGPASGGRTPAGRRTCPPRGRRSPGGRRSTCPRRRRCRPPYARGAQQPERTGSATITSSAPAVGARPGRRRPRASPRKLGCWTIRQAVLVRPRVRPRRGAVAFVHGARTVPTSMPVRRVGARHAVERG